MTYQIPVHLPIDGRLIVVTIEIADGLFSGYVIQGMTESELLAGEIVDDLDC